LQYYATNRTCLSLNEGRTIDGETFNDFLGDDGFETQIMGKFDHFLRESFGEQAADIVSRTLEMTV